MDDRRATENQTASASASDLARCLQGLVNDGRPAVSMSVSPTRAPSNVDVDDSDAVPVLQQLDGFAREELALDLPDFVPSAALWAARLFHQLCRFVVCRDIPIEQINAACAVVCPEGRGPDTDWSADLTLRHLPRLLQLARHLSNADPLVEQIKQVATAWPLSSVGIAGLGETKLDLESFIHHPGLRRLYADRIFAAGDLSRLGHPQLDELLRADLGLHRELAPAIAEKLFQGASSESQSTA